MLSLSAAAAVLIGKAVSTMKATTCLDGTIVFAGSPTEILESAMEEAASTVSALILEIVPTG